MAQMTYLQHRNRLIDIGTKLGATKRERLWGGINSAFGISACKLLHINQMNSRAKRHSIPCNNNGKECEIYICVHIN